jgi:vacuolar-type H+-ATPase subunit B/Vma2
MIYSLYKKQKENPKDEAIGGEDHLRKRDCKKLRFTIYEKRLLNQRSQIQNPKKNSPVAQLG